ncbi:response regulator [Paraherbaspirillum soli]|uniref:Response regulator n=1 Tax=Paraherbaspirillum soli TaxID=631222 RepID=A0ABW0M4V8_9BURK
MIKIILADDHPIIITGMRDYIDQMPGYMVVATASSTDELLARLKDTRCDMLIMEFSMPINRIGDGNALLAMIKRKYPSVSVIVLTMNVMPTVLYQIICSGVKGLLHKSDEITEISNAIQDVSHNLQYVGKSVRQLLKKGPSGKLPTRSEAEVLRMYIVGHSLHEIAKRLNKSVKTVGLQKASAMKKMGFQNDIELGRYSSTISSLSGHA